jgi:hypothetical protein
MDRLRKLLLNIFSERDNQTPDVVRIVGGLLAFTGGIEYLWLSAWDVIVNKVPFAHEQFGLGFSAMIATLGAAVAVKAITESKS